MIFFNHIAPFNHKKHTSWRHYATWPASVILLNGTRVRCAYIERLVLRLRQFAAWRHAANSFWYADSHSASQEIPCFSKRETFPQCSIHCSVFNIFSILNNLLKTSENWWRIVVLLLGLILKPNNSLWRITGRPLIISKFRNSKEYPNREWHKKTGTFEKPNKNWINPRKKIYWQRFNHYNLPFKRQ